MRGQLPIAAYQQNVSLIIECHVSNNVNENRDGWSDRQRIRHGDSVESE